MNLVACHIVEIHAEVPSFMCLDNGELHKYFIVDLTYNSHGYVTREKVPFSIEKWEHAKEKGYFLA